MNIRTLFLALVSLTLVASMLGCDGENPIASVPLTPAGNSSLVSAPTSVSVPKVTVSANSVSAPERYGEAGELRVTLTDDSVARYVVKEQLASLDLPNNAVGSTDDIEGYITFDSDGVIQEDHSRIRVDLSTLTSDKTRRDRYLRRNTFESDSFQFAEFIPRESPGLEWPMPKVGKLKFQLIGDMTIHGVTAPLTWDVDVSIAPEGANGSAQTSFPFHTFDMEIPKLSFILSVEDNIRLELDLAIDVANLE